MKSGASGFSSGLAGTGRIVGGEEHEAVQQQRELRVWERKEKSQIRLKTRRVKPHRNVSGGKRVRRDHECYRSTRTTPGATGTATPGTG